MLTPLNTGSHPLFLWSSGNYRTHRIVPFPLAIPLFRTEVGDSQSDGNATEPTAVSSPLAFTNVWNANFTPFTESLIDGLGGRSLEGSMIAWQGFTPSGTPWVHFQESGNQALGGQETEVEYGDTVEAFVRLIQATYPGTLISGETSFSFGREGEVNRDWSTSAASNTVNRSYNEELLARVQILANDGIKFYVADVDRDVNALIAKMENGYSDIEQVGVPFHFNGLTNFQVAMSRFASMYYNVFALDTSGVTVNANATLNTLHKQRVLEVIAENYTGNW